MAADNSVEANQNWRESGKCYRHVDTDKAINSYKNAIQHYLDKDRFNQAARLTEEVQTKLSPLPFTATLTIIIKTIDRRHARRR